MDQEDQAPNNPEEWTTIALAMLSSANAGTGLYILFLVFNSIYPLGHALLQPLKPSSAVKNLNRAVKATLVRYQAHQGMLGDITAFDVTRVYEFRIEALTLEEKHFQACQKLSLMIVSSWTSDVNDGRKIWVTPRGYHREIDKSKGELKRCSRPRSVELEPTESAKRSPLNGQDEDHASPANIPEHPYSIVRGNIGIDSHEYGYVPTPLKQIDEHKEY
ncbi:hypothetical protein F5146DRAFT_1000151 [Armillaria mellea]|nr:hypothetical protein F5146DRAFT_1000151 [Armillaria mellea]